MLGGGGAGVAKWGVVGVERSVGILGMETDVGAKVKQGFARTQPGMASGSVAYLFATHSILLIIESEIGSCYEAHLQVIQRGVGGSVEASFHQELHITESESFGATNRGSSVEVLSRAEEPEEPNDTQVEGVAVGSSGDRVMEWEDQG